MKKVNKKQLITLWVMAVSISLIIFTVPLQKTVSKGGIRDSSFSIVFNWTAIRFCIPILLIGSLLVYTFKER